MALNVYSIYSNSITRCSLGKLLISNLGACLFFIGILGLTRNLLNPFSFFGSILYIIVGITIYFKYSDRVTDNKLLSNINNCFDKTIVDLLHDFSPFVSKICYSILAIVFSSFLQKDELYAIFDSLPNDYDFLRKKGLMNLLTSSITGRIPTISLRSNQLTFPLNSNEERVSQLQNIYANRPKEIGQNKDSDKWKQVLRKIMMNRLRVYFSSKLKKNLNCISSKLNNHFESFNFSDKVLLFLSASGFSISMLVSTLLNRNAYYERYKRIMFQVGVGASVASVCMLLFKNCVQVGKYINYSRYNRNNSEYIFPIQYITILKQLIVLSSVTASLLSYKYKTNKKSWKWLVITLINRMLQRKGNINIKTLKCN